MKTKFRLQKIARYFLYTLLVVVFAFGILTPIIYWINNPELSQMQVFIKWWWLWVMMLFSGLVGVWSMPNNR
jgi:hypothetical protein